MDERTVVISRTERPAYPRTPPFHPDQPYPEYALGAVSAEGPNFAYRAVRESLRLAGLDPGRFGTPDWNPLAQLLRPGQFVLLKPNLVKEVHPRDPQGWVYTLTHGSVIRAVADYVWKALEGRGRVMVADAPQTDSYFDRMVRLLGLDVLRDFYRSQGLDLELVDMRKQQWLNVEDVIVERRPLPGDPNGYLAFDLADRSEFVGHPGQGRYYGADYDDGELNRHHTGGRHEYLISASAILCDVFINLPKLKTHKKAGITVNLKNLVGVNGDKNWLPHHTVGSPRNGGDQYPAWTLKRRIEQHGGQTLRKIALHVPGLGPWLLRRAKRAARGVFGDTDTTIRSGNWYGNDTTWRMCLDLNKLVLYGTPDGGLRPPELSQRKAYLSFVDGVIGGQGNGPMDPDPLDSGAILFGCNPVTVDACAAVLMGFDIEKLPVVRNAFRTRGFPLVGADLTQVACVSNHAGWTGRLADLAAAGDLPRARPHFGWVGHVEAAAGPAGPHVTRGEEGG